ncbi:hypothetical protein ABIC86_002488 [Paenibacillus sp. DS2363]|uniref:phage tail protein n=1 Tax=Paenibacillus sp. DS2363 TaxID=3156427 RepID=UPI003394DB58
MSDFIQIRHNFRQVSRSVRQMDKAVKQAVLSSMNRATQRAKTETGRKVRERYVIKQSEVVQTISVRKAAAGNFRAVLTSKGNSIPLINFNVAPKKKLKKQKPVKAAVLRGGNKKNIRNGFLAKVGSHIGVFERAGRKRFPIKELRGPAVPVMVGNKEVTDHVEAVYADEMEKRLPHELDRLLGRLRT